MPQGRCGCRVVALLAIEASQEPPKSTKRRAPAPATLDLPRLQIASETNYRFVRPDFPPEVV